MSTLSSLIFHRVPFIFTALFSFKGDRGRNVDSHYKTINGGGM